MIKDAAFNLLFERSLMPGAVLLMFFAIFAFIIFLTIHISKRTREINSFLESSGEIRLKAVHANFFGRDSLSRNQARGNGILAILNETLYFEMYMPKRTLEIPLGMIRDVERATSFLGKTKMQPLLVVHFMNEYGHDETAAWLVSNLSKWEETLKQTLSKGRRSL